MRKMIAPTFALVVLVAGAAMAGEPTSEYASPLLNIDNDDEILTTGTPTREDLPEYALEFEWIGDDSGYEASQRTNVVDAANVEYPEDWFLPL